MCYLQAARRLPPCWMPHGCLLRCVEAIPCLSAVSGPVPPGRPGDPLLVGSVTAGSFREARRPRRIYAGSAMGEPRGALGGVQASRVAADDAGRPAPERAGQRRRSHPPVAGPDGRAKVPNWERNRHSSSSGILYAIKREAFSVVSPNQKRTKSDHI
ncbi:uncharacterized protein LOC125555839 [Triticum urartu]|uniref:uncharacterized protein LOC125555839 n=1 Tax=Triticum urartu TaxID=4572 RepID=UPI002044BC88|nr:uncharacterized protein LOC125555839 [Triticum urartu]